MANVVPALEQQVFNVAQAQREADVHEPDQPDQFGRRVEAAKRVGRQSSRFPAHAPPISPAGPPSKLVRRSRGYLANLIEYGQEYRCTNLMLPVEVRLCHPVTL